MLLPPALPINRAGGGRKGRSRLLKQGAWLIRPSPRRGCRSLPPSQARSYLPLLGPDRTLAGPSTSPNGRAPMRTPSGCKAPLPV